MIFDTLFRTLLLLPQQRLVQILKKYYFFVFLTGVGIDSLNQASKLKPWYKDLQENHLRMMVPLWRMGSENFLSFIQSRASLTFGAYYFCKWIKIEITIINPISLQYSLNNVEKCWLSTFHAERLDLSHCSWDYWHCL